ncbi:MAG: ATP-binding protein [Bacteroidales bacterium]
MDKQDRLYIDKIRKRAIRTIMRFGLIRENDHVLAGLSGGKDSLVLLDILSHCLKHAPFHFDITAAHILIADVGYLADTVYLKDVCSKMGVNFMVSEINIDLNLNRKKSPCFVCSWARRKELFKLAKNLNCSRLALGHHMDDALETLVMNMMYHGSISSIPEKLTMLNGRLEVIRPLLHIFDDELKEFARIKDFKTELNLCKYATTTKRGDVKNLIKEMHKIHGNSKINIFRSMYKYLPEYLPSNPDNYPNSFQ